MYWILTNIPIYPYLFLSTDSQCTKLYYSESRKLLRLCEADQCQCMAGKPHIDFHTQFNLSSE